YFFRVVAVNRYGPGIPSWWAAARPSASSPYVPGPPWGLRTSGAGGVVNVSWNAPTRLGGGGPVAYRVQRSMDGTSGWTTVVWTSSRGARISGLRNGTRYFLRVIAVNGYGPGLPSWWTSAVPGGTTAPPPPPTGNCTT